LNGTIRDSNNPTLYAFLIVQTALAVFLVYRIKSARLAAVCLGIFTSSYAFFACFLGAMILSHDWL
jgi:hypothetical protein